MAKTAQAVIETKVKDGASAGFRKVDKAMKNTAKQGKVLNQQFRFMRGGLGQVGHQVQDVAVQLQMGQNAMLVFGQQGSQIASLFGPGGALLGAVLAVGAALSMALLPRLFGATEAMKKLKEESKSLVDRFDELTPAQKKFARLLATKSIKSYKDELAILEKTERGRLTTQNANARAVKRFTETEEEYSARITELDSNIDSLKLNIAELESKTDGTSNAFLKQSEALGRQTAALRMSAEQQAIAKVNAMKIDDKEKQQLITKTQLFYAEQRKIEAEKESQRVAEGKLKAEENQENQRVIKFENLMASLDLEIAKTKETEYANLSARIAVADLTADERKLIQAKMDKLAVLDAEKEKTALNDAFLKKSGKEKTAQMLGDAATLTQGIGKQSKKMAALQKTVQTGQAIMNTYTAASKAIATYGVPLGIPFAAMAVAQGMAQVQAIKSASFEGGGFTGHGSRSGGVDGKGGFPAILHPNETVIDHTKGDSVGGVVVNQVINISTGVQDTVRSEIKNLMPQIAEASKVAVAQETRRGGSYSQMIQGR